MKELKEYLADPIYAQCYEGIQKVLEAVTFGARLGKSPLLQFTPDDYAAIYAEVERAVDEVLKSEYPAITITNVRAAILSNHKYEEGRFVPEIDKPYNWYVAILVEMIFLVVLWDRMETKTSYVLLSFNEIIRHIEHLDTYYVYEKNPLWKLISERIPGASYSFVDKENHIKELENENKILKQENEGLSEQLAHAKNDLAELEQLVNNQNESGQDEEPLPESGYYQKVRLSLLYHILQHLDIKFYERGTKKIVAELMCIITDITFHTCQNACSDSGISDSSHEEQRTHINELLAKLSLNIRI